MCNLKTCATLAGRLQLLQAFLHAGDLFSPVLQVSQTSQCDVRIYNKTIKNAVRGVAAQYTVESISVTYEGTTSRKLMVILLSGSENGYELGKIVLRLVNQERLTVCVKSSGQTIWEMHPRLVLALDCALPPV